MQFKDLFCSSKPATEWGLWGKVEIAEKPKNEEETDQVSSIVCWPRSRYLKWAEENIFIIILQSLSSILALFNP